MMRFLILTLFCAALGACEARAPLQAPENPRQPTLLTHDIEARLPALPQPYREADPAKGAALYAQCASCHTLAPGAQHALGPNLYGVFARKVASAPDFPYSPALKAASFQWSGEALDQWLASPDTFLPGNHMTFAGMAIAEERRDLIAYLMLASSAP
jgi:cytochrome c